MALNGDRMLHWKPIWSDTDPYSLTSRGAQIRLPLHHIGGDVYQAILDCTVASSEESAAIYV